MSTSGSEDEPEGVVGSFIQPQQKWGVFTPNQK